MDLLSSSPQSSLPPAPSPSPPLPQPSPSHLQLPGSQLPSCATYTSKELLYQSIKAWSKGKGSAFVVGRSKTTTSGRRKVYYYCDRNNTPKGGIGNAIRKTQSRGTSCQVSIIAYESLDKLSWELQHRQESIYCIHNHALSLHEAAHPSYRQIPPDIQAIGQELHNAGKLKPLLK